MDARQKADANVAISCLEKVSVAQSDHSGELSVAQTGTNRLCLQLLYYVTGTLTINKYSWLSVVDYLTPFQFPAVFLEGSK